MIKITEHNQLSLLRAVFRLGMVNTSSCLTMDIEFINLMCLSSFHHAEVNDGHIGCRFDF
jgi:hypothetical protein